MLELSEVARAYGSLIGCAILLISLIGCAILLSCPQRYDSQWIHTIIRNRLVKQRCSNEEEGEEESDFAYGGVCNHIDEDHWRAPRPSRAGQAQYIPVIAPRVTHPGLSPPEGRVSVVRTRWACLGDRGWRAGARWQCPPPNRRVSPSVQLRARENSLDIADAGSLGLAVVMPFSELPRDELLIILERLAFRDLCRTTAVSSELRAIATDAPMLWAKCCLGVCDERLKDATLQRYTSFARGHLTHVEVINAPALTANALKTAVAQNTLQLIDLRECEGVDLFDLGLHNRCNALHTCRIAPQGSDNAAPHIFLSLLEHAADDAKPPCTERCRAMMPCQECTGFDFRTCGECDEVSAPWRECRISDCTAKLCDDCVDETCGICDKTTCLDHQGIVNYIECDDCNVLSCHTHDGDSCAFGLRRFHLFCSKGDCDKVKCSDCAFKSPPFMTCVHCYEAACGDCAFKGQPFMVCMTCYDTSCWDCAFKGGRYHHFCEGCMDTTCSKCVEKGTICCGSMFADMDGF